MKATLRSHKLRTKLLMRFAIATYAFTPLFTGCESKTLIHQQVSPDGKWRVEVRDYYRGDIPPIVQVWLMPENHWSIASWRFTNSENLVFARVNGCAPNNDFDANWKGPRDISISYPQCAPGPYRSDGDDEELTKLSSVEGVTIEYRLVRESK